MNIDSQHILQIVLPSNMSADLGCAWTNGRIATIVAFVQTAAKTAQMMFAFANSAACLNENLASVLMEISFAIPKTIAPTGQMK